MGFVLFRREEKWDLLSAPFRYITGLPFFLRCKACHHGKLCPFFLQPFFFLSCTTMSRFWVVGRGFDPVKDVGELAMYASCGGRIMILKKYFFSQVLLWPRL